MAALTDNEILAALPLESRQKITNAFEALSQCRPSAAEQAILFRVAHTLKLQPTDTIFSTIAAMHFYLELYQKIPMKISEVGKDIRKAGSEVEHAIRSATKEALAEHANALRERAALELTQAQEAAPTGVIGSKGIAGNAAAAESADAISRAVKWATGGVVACAVVFGGAGYLVRMGSDAVNLSAARGQVSEASARADAAIAAEENKASAEIKEMKASIGWLGTPEGRLARKFFDLGGGVAAAKCESPVWEIVTNDDGRFCVPKMRNLIGDDKKYGWKIP